MPKVLVPTPPRSSRSPKAVAWRYQLLDPTDTPEARRANDALFATGAVYGVEVTVPALAARCRYNLDPQHLGNDASTAAIEAALTAPLPQDDAILTTVRADLDSVGAMAVLTRRATGERLTPAQLGNIKIIALSDKFAKGPWPGPRPLPTVRQLSDDQVASADDNSYLAAIAAAVADYAVPLSRRVGWADTWITTGREPRGYRQRWVRGRRELARAIAAGTVRVRVLGDHRLAIVESAQQGPTGLGYHLAPVVIACNPAFRINGGQPHLKYSIAQWPDRPHADLRSVFRELDNREPGWGGSATIGGSPQGKASLLPLSEVVRVVRKHLLRP